MEPILEVRNLKKYFEAGKKQVLKAVDDVSFAVYEGETLGLVGESGCGKTTCGRICAGLYMQTDGDVIYRGKNIWNLNKEERRKFTKEVQIIFQDPYASLNPKMKVKDIIAEGIKNWTKLSRAEIEKKVQGLMEEVGLNAEYSNRYIHEFSGGQRQRIGIARALAVEPRLIVCDEPISALDVSIQAQIVNLLVKLQREKGLSYLFIAHDLAMVKYISHRVAVMYMGKIVEYADSNELYQHPRHPYTKALLSAIPKLEAGASVAESRIKLKGEMPGPMNPPQGCRLQGRCDRSEECCRNQEPALQDVGGGHLAACHLLTDSLFVR